MTPDRGDILHIQFDPASGREMKGDHYCLVVSPKSFNEHFRLSMVCPISGGIAAKAGDTGFLISHAGTGLKVAGNVHAHQIKTLDWEARKAARIEKAPDYIVQQVLDCLVAVLEDG